MKQTIWDKYWQESKISNLDEVITNDPLYRLLKRLIKFPSYKKNLKILEAGCGSGIRTLALLKEFQKYHLRCTLVDLSKEALLLAKKNAEQNNIKATFLTANIFKLPFPDESFDVVWNEGVIEHFDGKKRYEIFQEMARVCKINGQIIVISPNALNPFYTIAKKYLTIKKQWIYGFEKPYTIFELKNKMKKAGIKPITMSGAGVIRSFFSALNLIQEARFLKEKKKKIQKNKFQNNIIRRSIKKIDNVLEIPFGALLGKDIGIKGIKYQKNK